MSNSIEYWEKIRVQAAIAAMQGFCANPDLTEMKVEIFARLAVCHADALLAELKKEETK